MFEPTRKLERAHNAYQQQAMISELMKTSTLTSVINAVDTSSHNSILHVSLLPSAWGCQQTKLTAEYVVYVFLCAFLCSWLAAVYTWK